MTCASIIDSTFSIGSIMRLVRFEEMKELKRGICYKTHDFPPDSLQPHVKLLWLFGNPMNAVLSGYKTFAGSGKVHYHHINSPYANQHENAFNKDVFLLEDHFKAWYKGQNFEFLSVKYEALYKEDVRGTLNEFLGFDLKLLPFRKRETDWTTHSRKDELLQTYSALAKLVDQADDVKIWKKI